MPSFAHTQAATDGERGVRLVYYPFDLLHIAGWDVSSLQLLERKALLIADKPCHQFNGHEAGDGELILQRAGKLGLRAWFPRRSTRLMHQAIAASGAKPNG